MQLTHRLLVQTRLNRVCFSRTFQDVHRNLTQISANLWNFVYAYVLFFSASKLTPIFPVEFFMEISGILPILITTNLYPIRVSAGWHGVNARCKPGTSFPGALCSLRNTFVHILSLSITRNPVYYRRYLFWDYSINCKLPSFFISIYVFREHTTRKRVGPSASPPISRQSSD